MQIVLEINGESKTFIAPSVKARVLRNYMELTKSMDFNDLKLEDLDTLLGFICSLFGNQFTLDQIWDGIEAKKLKSEITRVFNEVSSDMGES